MEKNQNWKVYANWQIDGKHFQQIAVVLPCGYFLSETVCQPFVRTAEKKITLNLYDAGGNERAGRGYVVSSVK